MYCAAFVQHSTYSAVLYSTIRVYLVGVSSTVPGVILHPTAVVAHAIASLRYIPNFQASFQAASYGLQHGVKGVAGWVHMIQLVGSTPLCNFASLLAKVQTFWAAFFCAAQRFLQAMLSCSSTV